MKPEANSKRLLGITRSKAKMFEFAVPEEHHISPGRDPAGLFALTLSIIGDVAATVARNGQSAEPLAEAKQDLRFAAFFFDAYLNGEPHTPSKEYLILMAAAAYYLCDLPGSSAVLTNRLGDLAVDGECRDLDATLVWLLRGKIETSLETEDPCYAEFIASAARRLREFYREGGDEERILRPLSRLREKAYRVGSSRELLLADLISAVTRRRLEVSARACLPRFTGLAPAVWESTLAKPTFLREFWPSQRLLGEQGVFSGTSAIIQMPTSAGKTRATEILIRSAFFSDRTKLAVIVAPFRALCHEIRDSLTVAFRREAIAVDEVSDVPQDDFDLEETNEPKVLIVTPEKLLYLTRQKADLGRQIGLLVYDEGHQFDSGIRGVTYELLVTALKAVVSVECQVVLISAVMSNAGAINQWLNGEDGSVVSGIDLLPNQRSVAFASWLDTLGRLEFLSQPNSGEDPFFVPRVLESMELTLRARERIRRFFPVRNDEDSIALFLGLKLVAQGSVAIFCGRKSKVTKLCETLSDAYARELPLPPPIVIGDSEAARAEIEKLSNLVKLHYGEEGAIPHCASMGVFTHHGSTPSGVRLAVEHAMKESLVRMVICTSTLAQGVNLPIRYLIITGVYQGRNRITVRDFQNLIGRAGRSGMHTEGSVIFSDPELFDLQSTRDGRWRWNQAAELLDPINAEDCVSSLLTLFDSLENDRGDDSAALNVRVFFHAYLENLDGPEAFARDLMAHLGDRGFSVASLTTQLEYKGKIIAALESFMMAASGEEDSSLDADAVVELARGTLAYHLATSEQQEDLEVLFQEIAIYVRTQVSDAPRRKAYSRTLFGVRTSLAIHEWTRETIEELVGTENDETLLELIWPMLELGIMNGPFRKCTIRQALLTFAQKWIDGAPAFSLLDLLNTEGVRFGEGERPRRPTIDHVIDICENALAFEGVLVFGAIIEAMRLEGYAEEAILDRLGNLQKRVKYGLNGKPAILLHELGFADRVLAAELAEVVGSGATTKRRLRRLISEQRDRMLGVLEDFPAYYTFVWESVLGEEA
jgi:POLQ-like helicase